MISLRKDYVVTRVSVLENAKPSVAISFVEKAQLVTSSDPVMTALPSSMKKTLIRMNWLRSTAQGSGHLELNYSEYLESGLNVGDVFEVELRRRARIGLAEMAAIFSNPNPARPEEESGPK